MAKEAPEFEPRRVAFYKAVVSLVRAYGRLANEMDEAGYSKTEIEQVKSELKFYSDRKRAVEVRSGDYVDMKKYEPAMRQLLDQYVRTEDAEKVESFEELGLIELIIQRGAEEAIKETPGRSEKEAWHHHQEPCQSHDRLLPTGFKAKNSRFA